MQLCWITLKGDLCTVLLTVIDTFHYSMSQPYNPIKLMLNFISCTDLFLIETGTWAGTSHFFKQPVAFQAMMTMIGIGEGHAHSRQNFYCTKFYICNMYLLRLYLLCTSLKAKSNEQKASYSQQIYYYKTWHKYPMSFLLPLSFCTV